MKSNSIITLAGISLLLVSQKATALPSTPIKECLTKQTVPSDGSITTCYDFATKYNTTFEKLLLWNDGLHDTCDNLQMGVDVCVAAPDNLPPRKSGAKTPEKKNPTRDQFEPVPDVKAKPVIHADKAMAKEEFAQKMKSKGIEMAKHATAASTSGRNLYPKLMKDMNLRKGPKTESVRSSASETVVSQENPRSFR